MELSSQMILFAKVVDAGSFSGAARAVEQTPSAISRQIKQLEDMLSVRLLNRSGKGVTLTEDGARFYQRCRSVAEEVGEARALLSEMSDHPTGRLRVVCTVAFGKSQIIPHLPGFTRKFPDVNVSLTLTDKIVNLGAEGADIAIRFSEQVLEQSVISRKLADNRRVLVASPGYLSDRGHPKVPNDLDRHRCLRLSTVAGWNDWIPKAAETSFEANSTDAVYHAALAGLGIARLSTYLVNIDLVEGRLVRVFPDYVQEESKIMLSYAERRNLPPKIRAFIDYMVDEFGPVPPWERVIQAQEKLTG